MRSGRPSIEIQTDVDGGGVTWAGGVVAACGVEVTFRNTVADAAAVVSAAVGERVGPDGTLLSHPLNIKIAREAKQ